MTRFVLADDDTDDEDDVVEVLPQTPETIDRWQDDDDDEDADGVDEADGMDDAAVISDVEMMEDNARADAEAAYNKIFDSVNAAYSGEDEKMAEEELFPPEKFNDGDVGGDDDDQPKRRQITKDEYEAAASMPSSAGICARLAARAFAGERRAPSSTDFGRRFGKSFRVGWSPDGSFLQLGPNGTSLKRCRPVLDGNLLEVYKELGYLETHKANSKKIPTQTHDSSPRFALPMSMGGGSSHEALYHTISEYASKGNGIDSLAFSLLSCHINTADDIMSKMRHKEAVARFFVDACKASTDADIQTAVSRGNTYEAVFAALLGGDIVKACHVASEMGEVQLAAGISTYDADGSRIFSEAARMAALGIIQVPQDLMKCYKLISGDVSVAGSGLNWMRQFLIRLRFVDVRKVSADVSAALQAFDSSVQAKMAPFPSPAYQGAPAGVHCVLYRLLRLNDPAGIPCSDIVSPIGFAQNSQDYSLSFHLAASLAALGRCERLSPWQEEKVIDAYAAQLIAKGLWHWAVYACLVHLGDIDSSNTDWKQAKAKAIVLQKYNLEDSDADERKHFLEVEVGVPKEWLSEALALRSASKGYPFEYIGHLAAFDVVQAGKVIDDVILPSIFRQSQDSIQRSLALLEAFAEDLSPLSRSILNLFSISRDIYAICNTSDNREESLQQIPELREILDDIESALVASRSVFEKNKGTSSLNFIPRFDIIPVSAMLSEALEHVLLLRVQLKAFESGVVVTGGMSKSRLSALAFLAVDGNLNDKLGSTASMIRGLR